MSSVLFEKYKKWNYVDNAGLFVWLNKYGDVIKKEDSSGQICKSLTIGWSNGDFQNLANFHGIDFQAQMENLAAYEIRKSMEEELVRGLFNVSELDVKSMDIVNIDFDIEKNLIEAVIKIKNKK